MKLTEEQFLKDIKSYAMVKQHEQELSINPPSGRKNPIPTVEFYKGGKKAWAEIEILLGKRLLQLGEVEEKKIETGMEETELEATEYES